jgi:hypothetical protein
LWEEVTSHNREKINLRHGKGNAPGKSRYGKTFVGLDKPYNFSKGYYRTSKPRFITKWPKPRLHRPYTKYDLMVDVFLI